MYVQSPSTVIDARYTATLKNDDAEEADDEEGVTEVAEERKVISESEKRRAAERQPTGRIVGIIKRNWRS